jgi:hypothetical protein
MKRSSGPRKIADLSDSIQRQLNSYALAAGAAGVSLLALVHPSEAKIVYRHVNIRILPNHDFFLDVNHDGIKDFKFQNSVIYFPSLDIATFGVWGNSRNESWFPGRRLVPPDCPKEAVLDHAGILENLVSGCAGLFILSTQPIHVHEVSVG